MGYAVNWEDMGKALAAFERTRLSTEAPFDHFLHGDEKALNDSQRRGWALFTGKARSGNCHSYDPALPVFGDNRFHNATGNQEVIDRLARETDYSELGRFLVTKDRKDIGAFKTPFLRDALLTGPYMHDGSLETLFGTWSSSLTEAENRIRFSAPR